MRQRSCEGLSKLVEFIESEDGIKTWEEKHYRLLPLSEVEH
jgi:hypothetical protein